MKKIIATFILVLCTTTVLAEPAIDGYFWSALDTNQKTSTAFGYMVAMITLQQFSNDSYKAVVALERNEKNIAYMDVLSLMKTWATYEGTVSMMVVAIDNYYANREFLTHPLFLVIPYIFDKSWWNNTESEDTNNG